MQIIYSVNRVESVEISISNIPPVKFFVVLLALVLLFKDKVTGIVNDALASIDSDSEDIIGEKE